MIIDNNKHYQHLQNVAANRGIMMMVLVIIAKNAIILVWHVMDHFNLNVFYVLHKTKEHQMEVVVNVMIDIMMMVRHKNVKHVITVALPAVIITKMHVFRVHHQI